jgi:hypothetical protein
MFSAQIHGNDTVFQTTMRLSQLAAPNVATACLAVFK